MKESGKVIWSVTMSLDGFIAGPNDEMDWVFQYDDPNPLVDLEKVARILGWLDQSREVLSALRTPHEQIGYQQISMETKRRVGEESFLLNWSEGKTIPVETMLQETFELLENLTLTNKSAKRLPDTEVTVMPLSQREQQVLKLVAEGLSSREIAEQLFITDRTVHFHITSILNKFGAHNRAQAIAIADRLGLL